MDITCYYYAASFANVSYSEIVRVLMHKMKTNEGKLKYFNRSTWGEKKHTTLQCPYIKTRFGGETVH